MPSPSRHHVCCEMPVLQPATLDAIRDPVIDILRRSDLASISAKKVRLALADLNDPRYPEHKLLSRLQVNLGDKEQKKDVDELIRQCFDIVNGGNGAASYAPPPPSSGSSFANGGPPTSSGTPRLALPGSGGIPGSHSQPDARSRPTSSAPSPAPKAQARSASAGGGGGSGGSSKRGRKQDVFSDEEEEIDTAKVRSKAKSAASSKPKKKRKSAAANGDDGAEKAPPNPNNPFNKPVVLSDAMSRICGGKEVSWRRPMLDSKSIEIDRADTPLLNVWFLACADPKMPRYMITKQLWAYIKERDLQNPSNKRQVSSSAKRVGQCRVTIICSRPRNALLL